MNPEPFHVVAFGTPITIGLLSRSPDESDGELLTVAWQAKYGTSYLPYDEDETPG